MLPARRCGEPMPMRRAAVAAVVLQSALICGAVDVAVHAPFCGPSLWRTPSTHLPSPHLRVADRLLVARTNASAEPDIVGMVKRGIRSAIAGSAGFCQAAVSGGEGFPVTAGRRVRRAREGNCDWTRLLPAPTC
jgi:hypothetical protein